MMDRWLEDQAHQRSLVRLLRSNSDDVEAVALADTLACCSEDNPCLDGACRHCGRLLQEASGRIVEVGVRAPAYLWQRGRMSLCTIIPAAGRTDPDCLTAAHYEAGREAIACLLHDTQAPPAVFGTEVSFNEFEGNHALDHAQVHPWKTATNATG